MENPLISSLQNNFPSGNYRNEALQLVFENISDLVLLVDRNLNLVLASSSTRNKLKELMGIELKEGTYLPSFLFPEQQLEMELLYAKVLEGQPAKRDFVLENNQKVRYFENSYYPVYNNQGKIDGVLIQSRDLTEEKGSEERYRYLFYMHPIAMWKYDLETLRIIEANDSALELYGYNREEFLNLTLKDLRAEEDIPLLLNDIENILSGNPNQIRVFRHKRKNGELFYVEAVGSEIMVNQEKFRIVSVTDITDKIKAEHELRKSNERFTLAARASSEALWEWNVLSGEAYISKAYTEILGWKADEFNKFEEWHDYIHFEDKKDTIETYYNALGDPDTEKWEKEYRYLKADGSYAYVFDKALIIRDEEGKAVKVVGALKDITPQKVAEEELRKSNERFYLASKAASDAIYEWDIEKDIVQWGEGLQTLFGIIPKEFSITMIENLIHPKDRNRIVDSLYASLDDPTRSFRKEEYRLKKEDRTYSHVLDRGYIIRNENGKPLRMIGSIQDITERKINEEFLSLERKVFEMSSNPEIELKEIVDSMLKGLDEIHPETIAIIMLLNEDMTVDYLGSTGLPSISYSNLNRSLSAEDGSFGAAIHRKTTVTVTDITTDALFEELRSFFEPFNIKACWSLPVVNSSGRVIACFTEFYRIHREPSEAERSSLDRLRGILRVVLENHWSLQQIKLANERFDNMMKATHDLIWDWNLETNEIYRDAFGLKNVYGVSDLKKISNPSDWIDRIHFDDRKKVQDMIRTILDSVADNHFDVEYRFRRDDGTYSFVYDRGTIIRNAEGRPVRMIGAAQDISERKRLEKELLDHELEHQKAINQATVDTQEQERREIGRELHDNVNQVLTTTKLYLDLALANPDLKDDLISKSTHNILAVINEIRQLSRSLMDPSIGDLGLLASVNDLVENINLTRRLKVSLDADESIESYFNANHHLTIFRIIQEALNNAIKHAKATEVKISFSQINGYAQVVIEDNGVGFDVKTVKRGIGLKNIENRIYLVNGNHSIESIPSRGSRITINFPAQKSNNLFQ